MVLLQLCVYIYIYNYIYNSTLYGHAFFSTDLSIQRKLVTNNGKWSKNILIKVKLILWWQQLIYGGNFSLHKKN